MGRMMQIDINLYRIPRSNLRAVGPVPQHTIQIEFDIGLAESPARKEHYGN